MKPFLALLLLACSTASHAAPWIAHAQSTVPLGSTTNPRLNSSGLIGEVRSLPYQVPPGKVLKITKIALESYPMASGPQPIFVLFPWITPDLRPRTAPEINNAALISCAASSQTNSCAAEHYVPAGMWVNVTLLLGTQNMAGGVWAWYVAGELMDAGAL